MIELANSSPWLFFFCFYIFCRAVLLTIQMTLRHFSIRKAGCPPTHLDVNGD